MRVSLECPRSADSGRLDAPSAREGEMMAQLARYWLGRSDAMYNSRRSNYRPRASRGRAVEICCSMACFMDMADANLPLGA